MVPNISTFIDKVLRGDHLNKVAGKLKTFKVCALLEWNSLHYHFDQVSGGVLGIKLNHF